MEKAEKKEKRKKKAQPIRIRSEEITAGLAVGGYCQGCKNGKKKKSQMDDLEVESI